MKNLKFYIISKEQFLNTEFRPVDVEIDSSIETEDGWNYGDVIQNAGDGHIAEKVAETTDGLIVWKITSFYPDDDVEQYVVEITD